jgi:pyruvate/2-oxoglutarate dehydrogenase complex dihydrolipoamide dehydrogenase (E3) component
MDQTVEGDVLLVAVVAVQHRGPDLARAGVKVDERGTIPSTRRVARTSPRSSRSASRDRLHPAALAPRSRASWPRSRCGPQVKGEKICPSASSSPRSARGLTEAKAQQLGALSRHASPLRAARQAGLRATPTALKWVCDPPRTGARRAGDRWARHGTQSEAAVAIATSSRRRVVNTIHCHPTLSDAWMEAAHAFHGTVFTCPSGRSRKIAPLILQRSSHVTIMNVER